MHTNILAGLDCVPDCNRLFSVVCRLSLFIIYFLNFGEVDSQPLQNSCLLLELEVENA